MSGLSTYECPAVENKNQHQALLIQKEGETPNANEYIFKKEKSYSKPIYVFVNSEMSSNSKGETDLAASKPIGQSSEGEDIQSDDMILDKLEDEETAGNASMLVTGFFYRITHKINV